MKKLSILALACAAAVNFSYAGVAYDHSGDFYLPLNIGVYQPTSARNLDSSAVGSVGLGYNINNYFAAQTSVFGFELPNSNNNSVTTSGYYWNVEGRVNGANRTILTPYAVLGAGNLKVTSSHFAWDYGLGLNVGISPSLSFDTSWRQVRQSGGGISSPDNMYLGGIIWTFGAVKPVAAPAPQPTTQKQMLAKAQTTLKSILPAGVVLCKGNHVGNQAGCVTFEGNQMIMHLNIKFKINKAKIQDHFGTPIQSLGSFMMAYPNTNVTLYGYASSEGPLAFNQALSYNRAVSVKKYLVNQANIAPSRITTTGMGIKDPIASNKTLAGRQMNRRVEAALPVPAKLVQSGS